MHPTVPPAGARRSEDLMLPRGRNFGLGGVELDGLGIWVGRWLWMRRMSEQHDGVVSVGRDRLGGEGGPRRPPTTTRSRFDAMVFFAKVSAGVGTGGSVSMETWSTSTIGRR